MVVALVLCIFMHATTMVIAAGSMAASKSPELEAKALMETRWWNGTSNGTSLSHCKWYGITCNDGRSVTEIDKAGAHLGDYTITLNFSSFPSLVCLDLSNMTLSGSIPHYPVGCSPKASWYRYPFEAHLPTLICPIIIWKVSCLFHLQTSLN